MRCVVGVLVWLLASSAIAGEQAEPHTGTVAVAVHSAESGRASADEHGAGEGFERAAAVLRRYQAVLSRQQLARNGQRARPRTYRDLSGVFPAVAQPYVRGAMRLFGRLLGLVDEGSAYQGRAAGPQPQSVQEAIARVRELAAQGHEGAQLEAAEMELYGRYGAGADLRAAFERYQRLAEENGSATAQYMLGIFYATGLGGVDQENSLALLYMTLAAMQGHTAAEATLGFKHLSGIGVPVACGKALGYYQLVARKAIEHYQTGPPLGRALPDYRVRLADDGGGTYGVRTGPYALHKVVDRQAFGELLLYHQQNARDGNLKSCITLVDLYYHGHRFGPSNFSAAMRYARQVQQALFTGKQGELRAGLSAAKTNMAAQAAGMLGIMHLRGEGTAVDTAMALKWLTVGARLENALSLNALGVMYRDGLGVA
ncbi:ERAD-associated protein, partial [Coemansia spiralis]